MTKYFNLGGTHVGILRPPPEYPERPSPMPPRFTVSLRYEDVPGSVVYHFRCILSGRNDNGRRLVDLVISDQSPPELNGDHKKSNGRRQFLKLLQEKIQAQTDLVVGPVVWDRIAWPETVPSRRHDY